MADSKKHHFVPQCILRNFSADERALYVFDKTTGKSYRSSVRDAGHENNFNSVDLGDARLNFEDLFSDFDSMAAGVTGKIASATKPYLNLSPVDAVDLAMTACVQELRTKIPRTNIVHFANDMRAWLSRLGAAVAANEIPEISEDHSKLLALQKFKYLDELTTSLAMRGIMLVSAPDEYPFWTSDNPVIFDNHYPYSPPGFNVKGTDVFMPVSKNIGVLFICRQAVDQLFEWYWKATLLGKRIPPDVEDLFSGIYRDKIIPLAKENIDFYNSRQVQNSARFLYASRDAFGIAADMVEEAPALKNITKTFGLSQTRRYPQMPMGEHIVFFFEDDQFMVRVKLLSSESDVRFVTHELARLLPIYQQKKNDQPYRSIQGQAAATPNA